MPILFTVRLVFSLTLVLAVHSSLYAQYHEDVSVNSIITQLQNAGSLETGSNIEPPWWQTRVSESFNADRVRVEAGVDELLRMAIANSAKVSVARHIPQIRETAVAEANANFDWSSFVDTMWADTSEPVGSDLTIGGAGGTRFRDHNWNLTAGMRRNTVSGGQLDFSQQVGHQNNNSTFFTPNNQATSRIVLGYTQPLLRGRGSYYNTSLILLARIDVTSAHEEFGRQLQAHLLEVSRAYWSLYLERASLAQKVKLYVRTQDIYDQLLSRQAIDAQRTQLISAEAAFKSRESDLIRALAAVKNAETRLRSLVNAPELDDNAESLELIPADHPTVFSVPTEVSIEFESAMQNRPEIRAALQSIRAAGVRLDMATHEMLPKLNLITQAFVAGLRGGSDFGNAWIDQFREGEPSYSVGFEYEMPLGRRGASARRSRRELELSQMQEEYRNTLQLVRAEVEVAVREVQTAYQEMFAKDRARIAVESEAETLEARWRELADGVSAGLSLEALLRAQERVTDAEYEFARSQLTYNLALINLRHANGTLISIVDGPAAVQTVVENSVLQPQQSTETQDEYFIDQPDNELIEIAPDYESQGNDNFIPNEER